MVFDLRRALLAKEEKESARLMAFDFRLRVRTLRLLAASLGRDADTLAAMVVEGDDGLVLDRLAAAHPDADVPALFAAARAEARRTLLAETGDPTPHRLA